MYYNVDYEVCAALFLLLLLVLTTVDKQLGGFQSKMFRPYVMASFVNVCLDIITCYSIAYFDIVPVWVNELLNMAFLVIQCLLPNLFMQYVFYRVQRLSGERKKFYGVLLLPALFGACLVVSSPLTGLIYYFDETGYHHGPMHIYLYVSAIFYAFAIIWYTVRYWKVLKLKQSIYICAVVVLTLLPTIIQYFMPSYMLSSVGTALSVFTMFLTSENMITYRDAVTNALSREAFSNYIKEADIENKPAHIVALALDNFKLVNELYGMEGGNELMRILVHKLQKQYSNASVYRFGGDIFVVVLNDDACMEDECERIKMLIREPFWLWDTEVILSAGICLVHTKNHEKEELVSAIEYGVAQAKSKGKDQFFEVDDDAVKDIERRKSIEQAIIVAVERRHFEVHYQPIYDTEMKKIHSLEALARLYVPGFGYVSPEEFIRIAEQNGSIIMIGMLVLEEVCRFIKESDLHSKGIEFVEVNLSVVQCMQEKLCEAVKKILDQYEIPPEMINLEITETAAAYSEHRLVQNMERLSDQKITFSLDDYGSGYSNINYIVDLPFSIIKIDKYVVWAAMKKTTSRRILEHTIAMFKRINLKVVAEGIEDEKMVRTITEMGADYLQGYYFSKPVPKEELLNYLDSFEAPKQI